MNVEGVAAAIEALLVQGAPGGDEAQHPDRVEDLVGVKDMGPHHAPLVLRQVVPLFEDLGGDRQLAQVVEVGGDLEQHALLTGEAERGRQGLSTAATPLEWVAVNSLLKSMILQTSREKARSSRTSVSIVSTPRELRRVPSIAPVAISIQM